MKYMYLLYAIAIFGLQVIIPKLRPREEVVCQGAEASIPVPLICRHRLQLFLKRAAKF